MLLGAALGGLPVNSLADSNKGAALNCKVVVLQLVLDILNDKLISLPAQLLLKLLLLLLIDNGYEQLIDKPEVVAAHEDIIGVVDGVGERLQQRAVFCLLFEQL